MMASRNVDDTETILADLELTRGLTIRMTAIGTLGMIVGWAVFSTLYQMATGHVARFQFAPLVLDGGPTR
ncbi:hypothetical protein ACFQL0_16015 [Haloplanus litoreus]|uniref:hypothetical protein n=1 Tax=Haloplanus litoreus TaxID=767515 RepID=UPI00360794AC